MIAGVVHCIYRIIPTVRKHIVPQETLACAGVGVGVEEAAERWIVISALEVIEARFFDCGLSLRGILATFLIVSNHVKVAAPGGPEPSRMHGKTFLRGQLSIREPSPDRTIIR